ncbi:cytochrome O ubiquinol oxidase [Sphingomonas sp. Leaf357]|uniref:ubiquinol oxidase subunit II n=1 Tax=Sphingomonas sp. Leaf357 TaxID=1736350 RepID=UPI0006FA9E4C|nr:ubiquinol oxidase subunit II [Sphingomonas sp. Leaf357]KQS03835.1 cytochrome O ubiquinol oxidase [Sphingomonas sp. Leaf357]
MFSNRLRRSLAGTIAPLALLALGGCGMQVLDPAGDVARQQAHILLVSTGLMLLIIIPVMALTVLFAWRYRASNTKVEHKPDWDHSTGLELVIWAAPLLIVIALGAITWISTHTLDPYRRLGRIAPGRAVAANAKPLEIQVVALDWKWLFIYPEQGVATVNQLVLPLNREVRFRITSSTVMNSFYVPALAGQIYAMPGMETKLHAVLNTPGRFEGFSANYSGAGFSGMKFAVAGMDEAGFENWVARTKVGGGLIDAKAYRAIERPTENVAPLRWSSVEPKLFDRIVQMCVVPGTQCMSETMAHDMRGKMGGTMGHAMPAPTNDNAKPNETEGALLRDPKELGKSARPPAASTPVDPATHPDHR